MLEKDGRQEVQKVRKQGQRQRIDSLKDLTIVQSQGLKKSNKKKSGIQISICRGCATI